MPETLQHRDTVKLRLFIAATAFAAFVFIAFTVQTGRAEDFDAAVHHVVFSLRGPTANAFFSIYTHLGDLWFIVLVEGALLLIPKTRREIGVPVAATSTVGAVIFVIVKRVFARERPDESLRLISESGFSFPSGHSMNGLICWGMLIILIQRSPNVSRRAANILSVLMVLQILGIAFSRLFVGVHYATDVLGGLTLGLAYLMAATVVMDKCVKGDGSF